MEHTCTKNSLLLLWNVNITGHLVYLFAEPNNPYRIYIYNEIIFPPLVCSTHLWNGVRWVCTWLCTCEGCLFQKVALLERRSLCCLLLGIWPPLFWAKLDWLSQLSTKLPKMGTRWFCKTFKICLSLFCFLWLKEPWATKSPMIPCVRRCMKSSMGNHASAASFWRLRSCRSAWRTMTLRKTNASWAPSGLNPLLSPSSLCSGGPAALQRG